LSANVEFNVTAFDQASPVFTDVSESATTCFSTITTDASDAADSVGVSGSEMSTAMESSSGGFSKNAMAVNTAALSAEGLITSVYSLESAETALDKAHVTVEKDTNIVTAAQNAYNIAVAKFGSDSPQAELAASKLKAAQDALTVANQRVTDAQNSMNQTIMTSALTIIPSVIGIVGSLSQVMEAYPAIAGAVSVATDGIGTAMDFLSANPIVLVIAGIALLAVGLYEAYEHCAPFRDAINEIGTVLGGGVKAAFTALSDAANFLWNDVLKPLGEFIYNTFITVYIVPLEDAFNDLKIVLTALWNDVLVPVGNFLKGAFSDAISFVMSIIKPFEDAINLVSKALSPITDGIGTLTNALKSMCFAHAAPAAEEFNKQLTQGINLSNQMTQKLDPLKQGLLGVAGGANVNVNSASLNSGGGTQQITVNPTIQIGKIDRSTGLSDVISAISQGTAQALARRH